jgi:mycothiol synthase
MNTMIRRYREEDLQGIADLIASAEAVDQLGQGRSAAELRERFAIPGFDPHRDLCVVKGTDQRTVGFAEMMLDEGPEQSLFYTGITIHPDWREMDLEEPLLERLWKRATERRREVKSKRNLFIAYCPAHHERVTAIFESFGLSVMRYSPYLVYQPLENLPEPQFPSHVVVRLFDWEHDNASALEAYNEAFAEDPEYVPVKEEEWLHWLKRLSVREGLSYVALDGGAVVGFCISSISEERSGHLGRRDGHINILGVRPTHRRQGLGSALLLACLRDLKAAGMESVTIETDTDNPTEAMRLYEQVGFQEKWRWVTYAREIE